MSNRITDTFKALKVQNRKALVGYLTAGDPDLTTSEQNIRTVLDNGVDILEVGIPFSDPTADGPAIQQASQRALMAGTRISDILEMITRLRADYDAPIIMFGYANPIFSYGYEKLSRDAAEAGADGFLVVDMPYEECDELRGPMSEKDLSFIPLVAPTTPEDRAKVILQDATGFVYYIMVTGVTGQRESLAGDISEHMALLRRCTDLPIVVGFGVKSGEHARTAGRSADGVVVGSALVQAAIEGNLAELTRELREGLDSLA